MKTFRVSIDGTWSAQDFADLFSALNYLYSVFAAIEAERESKGELDYYLWEYFKFYPYGPMPERAWRRMTRAVMLARGSSTRLLDTEMLRAPWRALDPEEQLRVKRCSYASPGGVDLAGLGQATGHLKDVVVKLIDVKVTARERELRNQILEEDRRAAALRNMREEIAILKELGYSEVEIRKILSASRPAIESLASLAEAGKITHVSDEGGDEG